MQCLDCIIFLPSLVSEATAGMVRFPSSEIVASSILSTNLRLCSIVLIVLVKIFYNPSVVPLLSILRPILEALQISSFEFVVFWNCLILTCTILIQHVTYIPLLIVGNSTGSSHISMSIDISIAILLMMRDIKDVSFIFPFTQNRCDDQFLHCLQKRSNLGGILLASDQSGSSLVTTSGLVSFISF